MGNDPKHYLKIMEPGVCCDERQRIGWGGAISDSRDSDGNVVNVNWNDDKLNINWYNVDNCNDNLRARVEVSGAIWGWELFPAPRVF
jgi:hypothetical protein